MMDSQTLSLSGEEAPEIQIEVHGNLKVTGWDQSEVQATSPHPDSLQLTARDGAVSLLARSSCHLQVPADARLNVEVVHGNAVFEGTLGPLTIQKTGGNLSLHQVGACKIQKVYGNLNARQVQGDLRVHAVYGNMNVRAIQGEFQAQEAAKGNLVLSEAQSVRAAVLGNATLKVDPQPGQAYELDVSGNIHMRLAETARADVEVTSQARLIRLSLPDLDRSIQEPHYHFTLGDGGARVTLKAKGYVHIASQRARETTGQGEGGEADALVGDLTEDISHLIDVQMEALELELNERLSHLPEVAAIPELASDIDEIVDQARQYSTRAVMRAQTKAQAAARKAQEKLARKLEKARQRAARQEARAARRATRRTPTPRRLTRTPHAGEPVTEEERLLILKMLEEKKISLEEAEQLLAALEGEQS